MHQSSHKGLPKLGPNDVLIKRELFKKNADGTWTSLKNADIQNAFGIYRVNAGMTFKKNVTNWGIDVAALLESGGAA